MIRSILAPLDGSTLSEQALPVALDLAAQWRAAVEIVHVHEPLRRPLGIPGGLDPETPDCQTRQQAREYLESVCSRMAGDGQPRVTCALLEGNVADAIIHHAAVSAADVLVMAPRGRTPVGRCLLGSVADALVRRVAKPVVLVPPGGMAVKRSGNSGLSRILVPLDGSKLAEQILEHAVKMGIPSQTEFTLLRVVPPMLPGYPPGGALLDGPEIRQMKQLYDRELRDARASLERHAKRLRAMSFAVQTRVVTHRAPATAILKTASSLQADLIALATHGRSGLKRMLLGSVTGKVVRAAATPVAVYRPIAESSPLIEESAPREVGAEDLAPGAVAVAVG